MDGMGEPGDQLDEVEASRALHGASTAAGPQSELTDGQATPLLTLDGFSGPLDHLLTLARAQTIDLAALSLTALVDQISAALRQAPAAMPLGQKGDWVVMAAWLVQLRARLLLPVDAPAQQDAQEETNQLRARLVTLQAMQALAGWLEHRPQLGHDVFACGQSAVVDVAADTTYAIDVVEFLWVSLALFDDDVIGAETTPLYQPRPFALYGLAEARDRIRQRLAKTPEGGPLDRFLPDPPESGASKPQRSLRKRSAWSSTFIASLELAKQGEVVLGQGEDFQPIHLARV